MANGIVKWFNNTKGYGFIAPEEGEDLFVHYSSIQIDGYRTLKGGQRVAFEVQNGEKGAHAINVSPAADSPPN
ncbi:MAG: cold shock domain-containing protein [Burkholderiales bacterium]|nr:cold shock domain-containing protein [Burkholderiales bacterium]MDP1682908.1 cold shock domain-containing protein [Burkholderiales bacterium]